MSEIKVDTDVSQLEKTLQDIVGVSKALPFDKVAEALERHIRNTFIFQTDPWGVEWVKWLHPKQIKAARARREVNSDAILFDEGALFNSIKRESNSTMVAMIMGGTEETEKYASVHQYGDATHAQRSVFPSRTPEEASIPDKWLQDIFGPIQQAFSEVLK